jgi:hypothetical protein
MLPNPHKNGSKAMKVILPTKPDCCHPTVIARDQPEYIALPALTDGHSVVTLWQLTWRERFAAFFNGKIGLTLLTFGEPLQPFKIYIGEYQDEA